MGIHQKLTVPYSPQQNGVAERMNRTLMESARSMMLTQVYQKSSGLRLWNMQPTSETVLLQLPSKKIRHHSKYGVGENPTSLI